MHEASGEFNMRNQSYSEMLTIQILCITHSVIQVPIIVLQQSLPLVPHENPWVNAEKSHHLNTRSIQNVAYRRTQSYCRTHHHKAPPTQARKQISALLCCPPRELSHQNPHG